MILNTFAPPFKLVGGYFIVGILCLLLSVFAFFMADFNSFIALNTAGFMHIYFVGFVISIIIAALYQLTSVILEKPFFSIKGAFINLFLYTAGVLILSYAMISQNLPLLHSGGGLLFVSLGFFGITFFLSFAKLIKRNLASVALLFSSIYFMIGIVFGFILVLIFTGKVTFDFELILSYHIYFVLGFVFFVIVGVGSVLLPMFALSHDINFVASKLAIGLYMLCGVAIYFNLQIGLLVGLVAIMCFIFQVLNILKKRVRKAYDYWNLNVFVSVLSLFWGVVFYNFHKDDIGLFFIMYGFLYPFIVGHLYKIAPFLIWYHYISPFVGKTKVPLLDEMILKKVAYVSLGFNIASLLLYTISTKIAMIFMFASILLVCVNMINFFKFIRFGDKDER